MGFARDVWDDLKPKGKVCLVLLFPLAIAGVAIVAHSLLAERGCAVAVGFWKHVGLGAQALVLGLFLAGLAAGLLRAIIGIPEITEAAKQKLEEHHAKKAWEIEHYGHTISDTDWGAVLALLLICLAAGAVVILFGSGIGYIAWLLSC